MDIRGVVNTLIRRFNTRNPFEIISCLNVILVYVPLTDSRGFYQYFQRNNIIYINEDLPHSEAIVVCAHELGHMLLHKGANFVFLDSRTNLNTNKFEKEANIFAAELLIPNEIILENWSLTQEQLARMLGYEERFIEMRIDTYRSI